MSIFYDAGFAALRSGVQKVKDAWWTTPDERIQKYLKGDDTVKLTDEDFNLINRSASLRAAVEKRAGLQPSVPKTAFEKYGGGDLKRAGKWLQNYSSLTDQRPAQEKYDALKTQLQQAPLVEKPGIIKSMVTNYLEAQAHDFVPGAKSLGYETLRIAPTFGRSVTEVFGIDDSIGRNYHGWAMDEIHKIQTKQQQLKEQGSETQAGFGLGSGFASMGLGLGAGFATRSLFFAGAAMGITDSADTYNQARAAGTSPLKAFGLTAVKAVVTSALEELPLEYIKNMKPRLSLFSASAAAAESIQEGTQTWAQNFIDKYGFDPHRKLLEGLGESLIVGGIVGGHTAGMSISTAKINEFVTNERNIREVQEAFDVSTKYARIFLSKYGQNLAKKSAEFNGHFRAGLSEAAKEAGKGGNSLSMFGGGEFDRLARMGKAFGGEFFGERRELAFALDPQSKKYLSNAYKVFSGQKEWAVVAKIAEDASKNANIDRDVVVKESFFQKMAERHPEVSKEKLFAFVRTLNFPDEIYRIEEQNRVNFFREIENEMMNVVGTQQTKDGHLIKTSFLVPRQKKYLENIRKTAEAVFLNDSSGGAAVSLISDAIAASRADSLASEEPLSGNILPESGGNVKVDVAKNKEAGYNGGDVFPANEARTTDNAGTPEIPAGESGRIPGDDRLAPEGRGETGRTGGELLAEPQQRSQAPLRLTPKKQREINEQARKIVYEKQIPDLTPDDKAILRQYAGAGGLEKAGESGRGLLDEYYTPRPVIKKMWELLTKHGAKGGDILEPSAGIGRFFEDRPEWAKRITGVEIDPVSAKIAEALHPEATILQRPFEHFFVDPFSLKKKAEIEKYFNVVLGNPPYGTHRGKYRYADEANIVRYEEYFIKRGLDLLRPGGLLAYVIPSAFLNGPVSKGKTAIAGTGVLIDAYRLPAGIFGTTDIGTDIVIFQKTIYRKEQFGERTKFMSNRNFFDEHPEKILGEIVIKKGRRGEPMEVVQGDESNLDAIDTAKPGFAPKVNMKKLNYALKYAKGKEDAIKRIREKFPLVYPVKYTKRNFNKTTGEWKNDEEVTVNSDEELINEMISNFKQMDEVTGFDSFRKHQLQEKEVFEAWKQWKQDEKAANVKIVEEVKEKKEKTREQVMIQGERAAADVVSKYAKPMDALEERIWKAREWDGSVDDASIPKERLNYRDGKWYSDWDYYSGNIYERLDQAERDKKKSGAERSEQLKKQIERLKEILPERKTVADIYLSVLDRNLESITDPNENTVQQLFVRWLDKLPLAAFEGGQKYEIVHYVHQIPVRGYDEDKNEAVRKRRRIVGEKLFQKFYKTELAPEMQEKLEESFNRRFNGNVKPDYAKMPFYAKGLSNTFEGSDFTIRKSQLELIAFFKQKGVGIGAHDVGYGKTIAGIVALFEMMQAGWVKKPVLVVPNGVYDKWIKEILECYPAANIIGLGNLGANAKVGKNLSIKEGEITIMSYEALTKIKFRPETEAELVKDLQDVMKDLNAKKTKRDDEKGGDTIIQTIGRVSIGAEYYFEDFGFDAMMVDELHNFKNIFSTAKSARTVKKNGQKGEEGSNITEYRSLTGTSSARGVKMFLLSQYILKHNNGRNFFGLTATPFTNSPIEIYSVLSLVARQRLIQMGIRNINDFVSVFMEMKDKDVIKHGGEIGRGMVVENFQNAQALQDLIRDYIDFKAGDDAPDIAAKRPERLIKEYKLSPTQEQIDYMIRAEALNDVKPSKDNPEKGGILAAITEMRKITLSPYLSRYSTGEFPTEKQFVEQSPKIQLMMKMIAENKKNGAGTGQVVYMPMGVEFIPLLKQYLVDEIGFKKDEVASITGKTTHQIKENVKNGFNAGEIKVVIGTDTIKEGIGLQVNATDLYILSYPWRPTDLVQLHGRIWRQGNRWSKVRIHNLSLADTIDSFMAQKLAEKTARIQNLWSFRGNVLPSEELDFEQAKFELIRDPVRRVQVEQVFATTELTTKISGLSAEKAMLERLLDFHKSVLYQVEDKARDVEKYKAQIKAGADWAKEYLDSAKKNLGKNKAVLKRIENSEDFKTAKPRLEEFKKQLAAAEVEKAALTDVFKKKLEVAQLAGGANWTATANDYGQYVEVLRNENKGGFFTKKKKVKFEEAEIIPKAEARTGTVEEVSPVVQDTTPAAEEEGDTPDEETPIVQEEETATVPEERTSRIMKKIADDMLIIEAKKHKTLEKFVQKMHDRFNRNVDSMTDEERFLSERFYSADKEEIWKNAHPEGQEILTIKPEKRDPRLTTKSSVTKKKPVEETPEPVETVPEPVAAEPEPKAKLWYLEPEHRGTEEASTAFLHAELAKQWEAENEGRAYVIDPDGIMKSFPDYTADKAGELHGASSVLAMKAYQQALTSDTTGIVRFTAGGSGSGKSEILVDYMKETPGIIYDGTFAKLAKAEQMIEDALKAGKKVEVHAVYVNFRDAYLFALGRKDRPLSDDVIVSTHYGFRQTIPALLKKYMDNDKVSFSYEENVKDGTPVYGIYTKKDLLAITQEKIHNKDDLYQTIHDIRQRLEADHNDAERRHGDSRDGQAAGQPGMEGGSAAGRGDAGGGSLSEETAAREARKAETVRLGQEWYKSFQIAKNDPTLVPDFEEDTGASFTETKNDVLAEMEPEKLVVDPITGEVMEAPVIPEIKYESDTTPEDLRKQDAAYEKAKKERARAARKAFEKGVFDGLPDAVQQMYPENERPGHLDMRKRDINLIEEIMGQSRDMFLKDEKEFKAAETFEHAGDTRRERRAQLSEQFAGHIKPYFELKDKSKVEKALVEGDRKHTVYTDAELTKMGLDATEIGAYRGIRAGFDAALAIICEKMEEAGTKPSIIKEFKGRMKGYLMHKWKYNNVIKKQVYDEINDVWYTETMTDYKTVKEQEAEFTKLSKTPPEKERYIMDTLGSLEQGFFQDQNITYEKVLAAIEQASAPEDMKMIFTTALTNAFKEKGFGQHFIKRGNVQGYDTEDLGKDIADYFGGFAGFISKMESTPEYFAALNAIDARRQKRFHRWMRHAVAYDLGNDVEWNQVKKAAFIYFLANDISFLMANMTQNLIVGTAELAQHSDGIFDPEVEILKALVQWNSGKVSAEEQAAVEKFLNAGRLGGEMSAELMGFKNNPVYQEISSKFSKVMYASTAYVETNINRVPMFIAARRVLAKKGMTGEELDRKALELSDNVHFRYGKHHRPEYQRGRKGTLFVFTHYTRSLLWYQARLLKKHEWKALVHMMGWTYVLGGAVALPAVGGIASVVMYAIKEVEKGMGWDDDDDDKEQEEKAPGWLVTMLEYGVPAALGVDMSGKVSMNILSLNKILQDPLKVTNYLGAGLGGLTERAIAASKLSVQHRYLEAVAKILPDALGNPVKAYYGWQYGVFSLGGKPLTDYDELPMKYTLGEALVKMTGNTPTRESLLWEKSSKEYEAEEAQKATSSKYRARIREALVRGDIEQAENIERDAAEMGNINPENSYIRDWVKEQIGVTDVLSAKGIKRFQEETTQEERELYLDHSSDKHKDEMEQWLYAYDHPLQTNSAKEREQAMSDYAEWYADTFQKKPTKETAMVGLGRMERMWHNANGTTPAGALRDFLKNGGLQKARVQYKGLTADQTIVSILRKNYESKRLNMDDLKEFLDLTKHKDPDKIINAVQMNRQEFESFMKTR